MKKCNYLIFVIIIILFYCFNFAYAGRYICVDENGKEIECIPEDTTDLTTGKKSKQQKSYKGKPAGKPYKHLKKNDSTDTKK